MSQYDKDPRFVALTNHGEYEPYTNLAFFKNINNCKVGILFFSQLTSFIAKSQIRTDFNFVIIPPEYLLSSAVKTLRPSVDILVVVIEGEYSTNRNLLQNTKGIDLYYSLQDNFEVPSKYIERKEFVGIDATSKGKYLIKTDIVRTLNRRLECSIEALPINSEKKDEAIHNIYLESYLNKLNKMFPLQDFTTQQQYIEPSECGTCHKAAYTVFKNSKHITSYNSLIKTKHQFDLDCISCHSTYKVIDNGLTSITCQTCHNNLDRQHIFETKNGKLLTHKNSAITFSDQWCSKCHTSDNSAKFHKGSSDYIRKFKHQLDAKTIYGNGYKYLKAYKH